MQALLALVAATMMVRPSRCFQALVPLLAATVMVRPSRCLQALLVLLAATATLCWSGTVRAEAIYRVEYDVPEVCPDRARFVERIFARTQRARFAGPFDVSPTFFLKVSIDNEGRRGRLEIVGADGHELKRDVPGEDCIQVVDAMALISAVTMDPELAAESGGDPAKALSQLCPQAEPSPPGEPQVVICDLGPIQKSGSDEERWRFGAGFSGGVTYAVAPQVVIAPAAFADLSLEGRGHWAPAFRLSLQRPTSPIAETSAGDAQFTWTDVRLSGCPLRFPAETSYRLRPCLLFEIGALEGTGLNTVNAREETTLWMASGLSGRFEWVLFDTLLLDLEGGILLPLVRDRFSFAPDTTIHETPPVGWFAALSLGARLL